MFYNDNASSTGEYSNPSNRRKDDPHSLDASSFALYMQPSDSLSSSHHPQPQPIQQSASNGPILYPFDHASSSQQASGSYDPLFAMTGQDTYMDDLYKNMGSWSSQDAATTQQLLASFDAKQQQEQQPSCMQHQHQQPVPVPAQDSNMFSSLGPQDILLSDPTFVRQQQLLQEQQRAQREALQQQDFMDDVDVSSASVMFDDMDDFSFRGASSNNNNHGMETGAISSSAPMDISNNGHQLRYPPDMMPSGTARSNQPAATVAKPIKKDALNNRRSPGMRLKRTSSPIPINAGGAAAAAHARSSEIDHQRRQNELQARFRVNYNKKSASSANNPSAIAAAAAAAAAAQRPSGGGPSALGAAALGTSVPTMPSSRFDEGTSPSSFPAGTSPLRVGSLGNGGGGGGSGSSSGMAGGQAMSFPSRTMPIQIQRVPRPANAMPFDAEEHQRQLDEQLEKVDFDDITVSELKEMLRQRGKPATGKKVVLVQRLQEERELIKAVRSGKIQRHSQPPAASRPIESARPRSFQGASSPMAIHAAAAAAAAGAAAVPQQSPSSSVPSSSLMIPGSPNSVTMSLNRMHIGSPPMTTSAAPRRFSPYATPASPRLGSSSPKPQHQHIPASYSSSVPTTALSSSPGSFSFGSPLSSSFTTRLPPNHRPPYQQQQPQQQHATSTPYGRPKTYAPFTSSALATPDRDDDHDPFDDYSTADQLQQQQSGGASSSAAVPVKMEMDPTIESVLYGANNNAFDFDIPEGFTEEDLMAVLAGQGFGNLDMHSSSSSSNNNNNHDPTSGASGGGYTSSDMALFDNHVSHATPR